MPRTARIPTPIPMPAFAPVLRLLESFAGAVVLDGEPEAGIDETREEGFLVVAVVIDGTAVFRDVVVETAVALVVAAIVYPAAE